MGNDLKPYDKKAATATFATMLSPLDILSIESWILVITVCCILRYYVKKRWKFWDKLQIPYDPPSILNVGNFIDTFHQYGSFHHDNKMKAKYGPVWGGYAVLSPFITIHDLGILRQIYVKEFHNFPMRQKKLKKIGGKELNTALTNVEGDQWKRIRSAITPTFSTSKLKQMVSIIDWCTDNTVEVLNRKVLNNDGTFNSKDLFSRLSLDIICSTSLSTSVHSQDDSAAEPEVARHAKEIFKASILSPRLLMCLFIPHFETLVEKLNMTLLGRKENIPYFKRLTNQVIKQRESAHNMAHQVDLMQLMLDSKVDKEDLDMKTTKGMTKNEIIGNSLIMIFAGYENTANTMSFLAYNLAMHPEIQKEVQTEVDEIIKSHGKLTYDAVSRLKLLDMCTNETLRLYTPILRNFRICQNEVTINGVTIPKGVQVNIPAYGLAHDPEYWEEPFEFRPERMRDMTQIDPMVFQPFGSGPRNCIGMRFALMEIKMTLAKILHKFTIVPAEDTPKPPLKLTFVLAVRPVEDYSLRVVPRLHECNS